MVVHRRSANILLVISLLLLVSSINFPTGRIGLQMTDRLEEIEVNHIADVSPSIYDWGITGRANESVAFTVWANVTDDDGDLANVSVHVIGPNTTIHELMPFNGTFYVTNLDALHDFGNYDITVSATDLANHTRTSYHIQVEIQDESIYTPDPNITMPFVVASSIITGIIICVAAFFYGQRRLGNST